MSRTIVLTLFFFAAASFAGAGISYAIGRARELSEADSDLGMRTVSGVLFAFGSTCIYLAAGVSAIFAFGAVLAWSSYILTAQRLDIFQIERWRRIPGSIAERRPIA